MRLLKNTIFMIIGGKAYFFGDSTLFRSSKTIFMRENVCCEEVQFESDIADSHV